MIKACTKKVKFRTLTLILSALLLTTLFFSNFQTVNAASDIDVSEQVHLKWIVTGSGDQQDKKVVENSINKYLKDKINATLDLTTFFWGDDFNQKINLMIAAGDPYDINFTSNWAADYRQLSSISAYADITDLLDTYAPKTKALLGKNILTGAEVDGRIYALPVYNSSIIDNYGILLNSKLVKKYKIDTSKIKKLQDLEPILKNIKAREKKTIAFFPFDKYGSSSIVNTLNYDNLVYNSPGAVLRDSFSTKVLNEFETTDAKTLFTLMNNWSKAGYIPKSTASSSEYFNSNKTNIFAMYSDITAITCEDLSYYDKVDMVPIQLGKSALTTNSVTGSMHAISAMSKNPERALMLLELVNTDEKLSNLINYGVEGIHYKRSGTSITQLEKGNKSYNPSTTWLFGNETITYSLPGRTSKAWTNLNENAMKAVASPLLGFSFNSNSVFNEIQKINGIKNKYVNDLAIGKVNPTTTLAKMNSEMKKAGLKKVLTEMQEQVDEFIK